MCIRDSKEKAMVVLVYEEDNYIVNYPKSLWSAFGIDTQADAKLIAILPSNQIAVCNENLANVYGKTEHTFKMDVLDQKVADKNSLIDVLATL